MEILSLYLLKRCLNLSTKKSETMKFLEETSGRLLTLGGLFESIRLGEEKSQSRFAKKLASEKL